ncbi:MAG: AAA-like domain-containing protein [Nostoc sp. NMS1]|uniref:AAA-like domain-containing protein n=1 Tax=Nostoc sp. NMS1 TaxID=2815388 RepID=UPI0025E6E1EB|nr:AAA-like domain-containing protein [Nostoc sp. NMS1]MBN3910670.1 AAA-like domain-containing protein [Nostoc sp. NMS1]
MNKKDFDRIYTKVLTPTQKQVIELFLEGLTDQEIVNSIGANNRTLAIKHIKNICEKFQINNSGNWKDSLVELFIKYQPELVHPKLLEKYGYSSNPDLPQGSEPLKSPYYINRDNCESVCYRQIQKPGGMIRIKASKQMGKTSLIKRIIEQARNEDYSTIELNLSQIDRYQLTDTYTFLRGFYAYFRSEFPSAPSLDEWDKDLPSKIHCTRLFQNLLRKLEQNLVLILDEVDILFEYPEIYRDFFPMLRYWHERGKESETWEKLRLVISHSTQYYGQLDINESPFGNVGLVIQLEEFTPEQVKILALRHLVTEEDAISIMKMVGGHPYLVRLAFYHLYYGHLTVKQLIEEAPTDGGIYRQHLMEISKILQDNREMLLVFTQIINQQAVDLATKTIEIYKLEGMGLIKQGGNGVKVRCKLYQLYFRDRLYV